MSLQKYHSILLLSLESMYSLSCIHPRTDSPRCSASEYKREFRLKNSGNIIDFLIADKLIIEAKAKSIITKDDYYQTQRYLQTLNIKLGLLVNFRNKYLKPIRIIRIDTEAKNKFV